MKLAPLVGLLALLLTTTSAIADTAPSHADIVRIENELTAHIAEADAIFEREASAAQKVAALYARLDEKATAARKLGSACANGCSAQQGQALAAAMKDMEQSQVSFNVQYRQLLSQLQEENRSYTAVSNVIKTKHDTVKNSISNIH
jgi:hypothetical protein